MSEIRDIPADVKRLQEGDWIAFAWDYNGGVINGNNENKQIEVAQLVYVSRDKQAFSVNLLHGYKSISEDLRPENIIAIGSRSGTDKIKLFRGQYGFHILQPNHPVLVKHQEEYKDR